MAFIWFLVIGVLAGFLAGKLTTGRGFGFLGNLFVGVVGAMLGGFLLRIVGFETVHIIGRLISAVVGAVVLLTVVGALKKKS